MTVVNISAGATFDMNNNGETFGGLAGNGNLVMGTAGLDLYGGGQPHLVRHHSGHGQFNQNSTGTWSLGGTNTYTGATTVLTGHDPHDLRQRHVAQQYRQLQRRGACSI